MLTVPAVQQCKSLRKDLSRLQKRPQKAIHLYVAQALALQDPMAAPGEWDEQLTMNDALAGLPQPYDAFANLIKFGVRETAVAQAVGCSAADWT